MARFKQVNEISLDDGRQLKNFFWEVSFYGWDPIENKSTAWVKHWYADEQYLYDDVHIRDYSKEGGTFTLEQIENYLLTLDKYVGSEEV